MNIFKRAYFFLTSKSMKQENFLVEFIERKEQKNTYVVRYSTNKGATWNFVKTYIVNPIGNSYDEPVVFLEREILSFKKHFTNIVTIKHFELGELETSLRKKFDIQMDSISRQKSKIRNDYQLAN